MKIQLKHSNVLDSGLAKQPTAVNMLDGEVAVNFNANDPAIFIKNSNGDIVRIAGKDNLAFTGYEASIQAASTPPAGLEAGNLYFDTDDNRLYYYYNDGTTTQWVDASTEKFDVTIIPDPTNLSHQSGTLDDRYVNSNGDTMTGNLVLNAGVNINSSDIYLNNGKITFEGASANAHEIRLTVIEPTADRTLSLPDTTGTIISTGDTGTVTGTMIADGTIQNTDISNTAAIGLSKLATGSLPSGITVASTNIVDGSIVDADINSSAAITLSKLGSGALPSGVTITSSSIAGGVSPSDIASGALPNNVTVSTSNIVDGTIVDADINTAAKIQVSKLADGSSRQLLQVDTAGTNVEWTSNVDIPGTLDVTGNSTFDGNATVLGNFTVDGSTVALNANIVTVKDTNIQLGVVSTPTDTTADGGGITLKGSTDKTFGWLNSTDSWTSSENLDLASGKAYYINGSEVLNETSLASGVTGSSLTSVGTISNGTWQGTQITDTYLGTISTAGKVANSATTATNLNSGNAIVARDGSGDFTARNITASLIGNADSADKLSTARTISLTGDLTGSASFDGTANISINTSAVFTGTTNLSYITGTRTVASDTGTNAVLPLFSNTDAGLTGASGGGTVNYLRADGSWATPPGVATNLGFVVGTSTVTSSTGTGVALPVFTSSNSGLVQGSGGGTTKFLRADGNWIALGSSSTSVGTSPPSNPAPGDSWFDTDEGRTYIYYQDTDSSQWIESNPSWNGGIPVGSVTPSYLSTGGPNWDASGNLTAAGSITAASGVITGTLTKGGSNVLTAGDTGTVTTAILADGAVTEAKLDDGSVSDSKLAANSVTTTKIANAAITSAKLGTEAVATTNITDVSVTTAKIADDAVTAAKLADTSVTAGSYTVSSITVDEQGRITSAASGPTVPDANKIIQGNTEAEVVDTGSDGHFKVTTEGVERLKIDSSGRVGIGDLAPDVDFSLKGVSDVISRVQATDQSNARLRIQSGNSSNSYLEFGDSDDDDVGEIVYGHSDNHMRFRTNGAERLRIDSSGNVKIASGSTWCTSSGGLQLAMNSNDAYITTYYDSHSTTLGAGTSYKNKIRVSGTSADNNITFHVGTSGSNETMRIDGSGNVGIGTTSPGENLHVFSSTGAIKIDSTGDSALRFAVSGTNKFSIFQSSDTLRFFDNTNNSERMRIDSSGNVGIGTSTTVGKMTVKIDTDKHISFNGAQGEVDNVPALVAHQDNGSLQSIGMRGVDLRFATATAERMRIDSSGNVGIGTSSPGDKLTVQQGGDDDVIVRINGADSSTEFCGLGVVSGAATIVAGGSGTTSTSMSFKTASSGTEAERMRIDSSGIHYMISSSHALIASTTRGAGLGYYLFAGRYGGTEGSHGSGTNSVEIYSNGNVRNTNNSYTGISDIKLKENIVHANSQWDDLKALQVRNYNFIEGQTHTQLGLIAQEVELVSPGLVSESPDRDEEDNDIGTVTKSVNYSVLYMKAVKALQEAMDRIETLEQRLSDAGIA